MVPIGSLSGNILFFSGEFNVGASGNPVPARRLSFFRNGKVNYPEGPSFSTIDSLAQLDDNIYLGVDYWLDNKRVNEPDFSVRSVIDAKPAPVEIMVSPERISAKRVDVGEFVVGSILAVATHPDADMVVFYSQDFSDQNQDRNSARLTITRRSFLGKAQVVFLPADLRFSDPFLEVDLGGQAYIEIIGAEVSADQPDKHFFIYDIAAGKLEKKRLVELKPSGEFFTSVCEGND